MVGRLYKGYPVKDTVSIFKIPCQGRDPGSNPGCGAKFCKCQQENVTLSRFLRRTEIVEGKRVQLPTVRKGRRRQVAMLD